jgi:hypothetical protein
MIEMLEKYVQYGDVHITAWQGFLFKAGYKSRNGEKTVIVKSDRGLDHLYMILASELSEDKELKLRANTLFVYPLSKTDDSMYERSIRHAHVEMSFDHEKELFDVFIRQAGEDDKGFPGTMAKKGHAKTLADAFAAAIKAKSIPIDAFVSSA